MAFLDHILGLFGIKRINFDNPLTLLGQNYLKVLDKLHNSMHFHYLTEQDWEYQYTKAGEEDPNVYICQWETVKVIHTFRHDENEKIVNAGRIYIDKDERFIDDIIRQVTAGRRRIVGKVYCRHYDFYDDERYYYYNDDVYLLVHKETGWYDGEFSANIEYVLREPPKSSGSAGGRKGRKSKKNDKRPRTINDHRKRIKADFETFFLQEH